jgi:hypothetical protein
LWVVAKIRCHQKVAPILLRQFDRLSKSHDVAATQLQSREADPFQLELVPLFAEGKVVPALLQQKFSNLQSGARGK